MLSVWFRSTIRFLLLVFVIGVYSPTPTLGSDRYLQVRKELNFPSETSLTGLVWSPNGKYVAGLRSSEIIVWDVGTGDATTRSLGEIAWSLAWASEGSEICFTTIAREEGTRHSVLKAMDVATGSSRTIAIGADRQYHYVRRNPAGEVIISGRSVRSGATFIRRQDKHQDESPVRIWMDEDEIGNRTLLYSIGASQPKAIPWGYPILAAIYPSEEARLIAFKTVRDDEYLTLIRHNWT